MGRRLALLIATYQYQDTDLRQLTAPAHDAEAFAAVLRNPDIAGFEVTTLINEPRHRVGEAIGDFYRDRRSDDLTLLYFTGHGLKDDDGRLYLAMANTRRDSLLFTGLSAEQIDQAMDTCVSRQKVLILDCCYSGAFPAGRLAKADTAVHTLERFQGRGRTVLTASDATQYSFEGNKPHGQAVQSVFTRYLVAGLRDGSADLDGDGDITLDELYSYVHDRVVEEMPQQRPKKQVNVEGRTVIARNINWTLPAYLRNAIASPIATDRLAALDGLAHLYRIGNDNVRGHVAEEIRRLADDDSRMVSAAATARLQPIHSIPTEVPLQPDGPVPDSSAPVAETPPDSQFDPAIAPEHDHRPDVVRPAADSSSPVPPANPATATTQQVRPISPRITEPDLVGQPQSDAPPLTAQQVEPDLPAPAGLNPPPAAAVPATSRPGPPTADQQPSRQGSSGATPARAAASASPPVDVPGASGQATTKILAPPGAVRGDPSPVRRSRLVPRTRLAKALAGAGVIAYALTFTAGEPIVGVALFVVAAIVTVVVVTKQDLHRGARDWLAVISGGLALLAGVLIAAGVDQRPLAATVETDSWAVSSPGFWESLNWYILGTAVVAGAAGICTIASRTRSLVGPGVIVGAAAASTWGLVFFAGELNAGWRASPRWPEFAGHVALILAAGLACIVVKRNGAARLVMRRPRDARSWLVLTVGGLATAALVLDLATALYHTSDLERLYVGLPAGAELGDRALAYRVAIIMAVNTPLWAAVAAPRRFGLSVFTGFIGGGAAIALCDYAWGTQA